MKAAVALFACRYLEYSKNSSNTCILQLSLLFSGVYTFVRTLLSSIYTSIYILCNLYYTYDVLLYSYLLVENIFPH